MAEDREAEGWIPGKAPSRFKVLKTFHKQEIELKVRGAASDISRTAQREGAEMVVASPEQSYSLSGKGRESDRAPWKENSAESASLAILLSSSCPPPSFGGRRDHQMPRQPSLKDSMAHRTLD